MDTRPLMAKKGKIEHNQKRIKMASIFKKRREELRALSKDLKLSPEERTEARMQLTKLPRNSSSIRIRNRCALTGRPRAVYRKFGLARIKFREMALKGELPGVTKSSW